MSKSEPTPPKKNAVISKKNLKTPVVFAIIALVFGAVLGYALLQELRPPTGQKIDRDGYQAVYTTSGQLFFGKLQNAEGTYLVLKTPYTAQDVAPPEDGTPAPEGEASTSLLRVSSQLYGPDESMAIRAEQVTFWQNLRDDSKVSQAIKAKE